MVISFKVVNQTLYPVQTPSYMEPVYANSIGYLYAQFTFSPDWDELNRTAIFVGSDGTSIRVPLVDGLCLVPHEVIKTPHMNIGVVGINTLGEVIEVPSGKYELKIKPSIANEGKEPSEPTPDVYAMIVSIMQQQAIDASRAEAASIEAQSYAKFGTFSLDGNMLVATVEAADDITDIKINEKGELVITFGD